TPDLVQTWSVRADEIVAREWRVLDSNAGDSHQLRALLREADAAAEALEEAAFMVPLVPEGTDQKMLSLVSGVADLVGDTVRQYVRSLEEGQDLSRSSPRTDVDAFLVTIDRLVELGQEVNAAKRTLTERLLRGRSHCHALYVLTTM